jgi:hypothetical protein
LSASDPPSDLARRSSLRLLLLPFRSDLALPLWRPAVTVPPRWRLFSASPMRACAAGSWLRGLLCLSSFASRFHTCFRFLLRCFGRSPTFRPAALAAAGSQEPVVVFPLVPIGSRSLLFDFAGAADAMSPLGVGRQWTPRRSWGGW